MELVDGEALAASQPLQKMQERTRETCEASQHLSLSCLAYECDS